MGDFSMSKSISRRSVTAALAAIPAAVAMGAAAAATNDTSDAELRRLWAEYRELNQRTEAAWTASHADRDLFDRSILGGKTFAELRDDGIEITEEMRADYRKAFDARPRDNLWENACELDTELHELVRTIRATPAEGLFGLAIKLTALPAQWEDYHVNCAALSALGDINRILGTEFTIDGKSTFEEPDDAEDAEEGDGNG